MSEPVVPCNYFFWMILWEVAAKVRSWLRSIPNGRLWINGVCKDWADLETQSCIFFWLLLCYHTDQMSMKQIWFIPMPVCTCEDTPRVCPWVFGLLGGSSIVGISSAWKRCCLKNITRGTTDPEIDSVTWTKFGNHMAPFALVSNLATRWCNLH